MKEAAFKKLRLTINLLKGVPLGGFPFNLDEISLSTNGMRKIKT